MKKMKSLLCLVLALLMVTLVACKPAGNNDPQTPSNPGTTDPSTPQTQGPTQTSDRKTDPDSFVWGAIEEPASLEPAANAITTGFVITNCVYDNLLVIDKENGGYKYVLAESVEYADDTTLNIKLKDGIYFTNGEPLTADDVLFTLERLAISSRFATNFACVDFENTVVVDDLNLQVKLNNVYAPLLSYLAGYGAAIMNRDYFNSVSEEEFARHPIGTGAFKFVEWVAGSSLTLERNEEYWGDKPAYSKLIVRFIPESTTRFIELETGNVDGIGDLAGTDMDRMSNGGVPGAVLYAVESNNVATIEMNKQNEILTDKNVRLAIAHAVDWAGLVQTVYGSSAVLADSIFAPSTKYYVPAGTYEYNPDLAKQYLADAGYPNGGLTFTCVTTAGVDLQTMEIIQAYLSQIGITLDVEMTDFGTMISKSVQAAYDIGISNISSSSGDPDQSISNSSMDSGFAIARINDQALQDLYTKGARTVDENERAKVYQEIAQYYYDECVRIPVRVSVTAYATRDYVNNFDAAANGVPDLRLITFD